MSAIDYRRRRLLGSAVSSLWMGVAAKPAVAASPKVLRVAFSQSETGFDPARHGDLFSGTVIAHIFEPLFTYDPLALPVRLVPLTATSAAEATDGYRSWTVRIRPGIYFAEDPVFAGRKRELTADDYVYSLKRFVDPVVVRASSAMDELGLLGLAELGRQARDEKRPLDYNRPIEGLVARDRYTLLVRTKQPRPRLPMTLASSNFGALAHEVVDAHGEAVGEHPVGTGPYRLAQWRRGSRIVLERNPLYRERTYYAEPAADDVEGVAIARHLSGRRVPMIDRVEISIIQEDQPRWLEFVAGRLDMVLVPGAFQSQAMPGGRLAHYLARRGIVGQQVLLPAANLMWFNMRDPVVGGYEPQQVALRRAIALGMDCEREIRLGRGGQGIVAHTVFAPHQSGFDMTLKSEMGQYSPARANALLDLYGYLDRDGDGWRERPDGQPLILERATQSDQRSRFFDESFERDMRALGLLVRLRIGQWGENAKAGRAGKLMMWSLANMALDPDGQQFLQRYYSKADTFARFSLPAMDRLYERLSDLPDGTERLQLMREAQRLAIAWMPYKYTVLRVESFLTQPRLVGFRQPMFRYDWYHLVDIGDLTRGSQSQVRA